jgi:hypothetical protein
MPKLILNISFKGRAFTLAAFYVMISRVRSFEGLRLLERDWKAMGKLLELKPNEHLHAWENGYDKDGAWDGTRAMAALTALRRDRSKAAAKGAEEKAAAKKDAKKASAAAKREKAVALFRSAKAKAKKEKTAAAAAAAAAAARERVAEKQPSAKRHEGSRPATLQARVSTLPSVGTLATVTAGGAAGGKQGTKRDRSALAELKAPPEQRPVSAGQQPPTPSTGLMASVGTAVTGRSRARRA